MADMLQLRSRSALTSVLVLLCCSALVLADGSTSASGSSSSDTVVGEVASRIKVGPGIAAVVAILVGAAVGGFGFKLLR
ncbi:hypothetical protein BBJ28_00016436, partial [Nothophytophthora sp. Chile5]